MHTPNTALCVIKKITKIKPQNSQKNLDAFRKSQRKFIALPKPYTTRGGNLLPFQEYHPSEISYTIWRKFIALPSP